MIVRPSAPTGAIISRPDWSWVDANSRLEHDRIHCERLTTLA
jgi:hypothetical protein